ncbi:MAG TPA: hypothetical protein VEI48_02460 [Candidatus Sulfotelmatobacter sp.]|nr:hypothetical protein [Candidatus Sulfotelmatobacter sp.]
MPPAGGPVRASIVAIVLFVLGIVVTSVVVVLLGIGGGYTAGPTLGVAVGIAFVLAWRMRRRATAPSLADMTAAVLAGALATFWGGLAVAASENGPVGSFFTVVGLMPVGGIAGGLGSALLWRTTGHRVRVATVIGGLLIGGLVTLVALAGLVAFGARAT